MKKQTIIRGLEFITVVLLAVFFRGCMESKHDKRIIEEYKASNIHFALENMRYIDRYNREHVVAKQAVVDKLILEQQVAEQAALLKIKPKQIKGKTEYITNTEIIKQVDTVYQDAWVKIERGDNDTIKMNLIDTITLVNYWKRKWFLAPKQQYVDVSNKSPYIRISKVYSIGEKPKQPTFILGPSVQYGFIPNQANIGISLLYFPLTLKF